MKNDKFEIFGVVVHGHGNGKKIGMPTANIDYKEKEKDIENGVYASAVYLKKDNEYIGVTNIGTRPSVDNDKKITVETNILDFDEDIYGENIKIVLLEKIREIRKFENLEAVKKQVDKDKIIAREIYKKIYDKKQEEK